MREAILWFCRPGCLVLAGILGSSAFAAPFELVSSRGLNQPPPSSGNGISFDPVLSPDGRYVLFASEANNLVTINQTSPIPLLSQPKLNVYLRDRSNGITTLVSVNLAGTGGGNGDSFPTGISTNGRFALFESTACDLVPGDTNNQADVFMRDLFANTSVLISGGTNESAGNGVCRGSTMTPDGRFVAFTSAANNLAPNDTNALPDVFVRDTHGSATVLASVGARATNAHWIFAGSEAPIITPDGRHVAFYSAAGNLGPGVTNRGEIYVRDLVSETTTWVSAGARAWLGASNVISFNHALSADGRIVAYESCTNLFPAAASADGMIFRFTLDSQLTECVSTNAYVPMANVEEIRSLDMTSDGRFIAFVARTTSSSQGLTIRLWDAQTKSAILVSGDLAGNVAADSISDWPALDASGRFVAFLSSNTNMVANPLAGAYHLYVRDVQTGTTTLVDVDTAGKGAGVGPDTAPGFSADGKLAVFVAADAKFVVDDLNHDFDVFLRDLDLDATELISMRQPLFPSASANGPALSPLSSSAGGHRVAFSADADDLVANDTNGIRDVFVRDRQLGTNLLVSLATNGASANNISSDPAISIDGRFVAFASAADNLVPGDTNRAQDVFLRDLESGATALVSVNLTGFGPGNKASSSPLVGRGGRFILFRSQASNLATGTFNGDNLFLRDRQSSVTYSLTGAGAAFASMTSDGDLVAYADWAGAAAGRIYVRESVAAAGLETNLIGFSISSSVISPDGRRIACFAATNRLVVVDRATRTNGTIATAYAKARSRLGFSADARFLVYSAADSPAATNQVYLYDFDTGVKLLVSSAFATGLGGNAASDSADISADGRFVAFRSFATDLVSAPVSGANGAPALFLFDRLSGDLSHLTGAPPNNRSLAPVYSPDGRTLFFQSWASDLVPLDFNHHSDVFALSSLHVTVATVNDQGAILTWPVRPGERYRAQFKNSLADTPWEDIAGLVTIEGNQARLSDTAPASGQRFYRVVAY